MTLEEKEEPWTARWITGSGEVDDDGIVPPYHFLGEKTLGYERNIPAENLQSREIIQAKLYASALGCYNIKVNGREISQRLFAPGYTQYTDRVLVNAYDVTEMLQGQRRITIDMEVSGGWYCGRLGLSLKRNRFGDKRAAWMELRLCYSDGSKEKIITDETWKCTTDGPRRFADFFDGEIYDARCENFLNWNLEPATLFTGFVPKMELEDGVPVKKHHKLQPVFLREQKDGTKIFAFERNFAGIVGLKNVRAEEGQKIEILHGELLKDGEIYRENLRTAQARLCYICKEGVQSYEPRFTYMGFQYIAVKGTGITAENLYAYEIYSDMEEIGSFSCSDPLLNCLHENILTSLKANFVDIPTDCPQRDERCGWTGDIALFAPTASFLMDVDKFMQKWCKDVVLNQKIHGIVPVIVPDGGFGLHRKDGFFGFSHQVSDAVWGDCVILVPWAVYQSTGNQKILEIAYEGMKKWVAYEQRQSARFSLGDWRYIWSWGLHFGDWLAPGASMLQNMRKAKWTSTAYFAHSAQLLSKIADILGREEDARYYQKLFHKIKKAFRRVFIGKDHNIRNGFQSIYALALCFDLVNDQERAVIAGKLAEDVRQHEFHLTTGFVGTPYLPYALSDNGYEDVAWKLLLQESCPGWLYPVVCGATSVWERWDALKPDGNINQDQVGADNMVSFNHYAYGAIGQWMYERIGGIEMMEPGYQRVRIAPLPGPKLTWAKCAHRSPFGWIRTEWSIHNDIFTLEIQIPEGVEALMILLDGTEEWVGAGTHRRSCCRRQTGQQL